MGGAGVPGESSESRDRRKVEGSEERRGIKLAEQRDPENIHLLRFSETVNEALIITTSLKI